MARVVLMTRDGCYLCQEALSLLHKLAAEFPIFVQEVDITSDPAVYEKYRNTIPVVLLDGQEVAVSKVSEFKLRKALARKL